jgi:hypothetical protein
MCSRLSESERDEIGKLLAVLLRDVANGERTASRVAPALQRAFEAAICQSANYMSELRLAAAF